MTLGEILDRSANFPKAHRFTFGARVEGLALEIMEKLVRARWAKPADTVTFLQSADADLAVLRVLVRLSFERKMLSRGAFEQVVRELDTAGRMMGGWRTSL